MLFGLETTHEISLRVEIEDERAARIGPRRLIWCVPPGGLYPHAPLVALLLRLERARCFLRATSLEVSLRSIDRRSAVGDWIRTQGHACRKYCKRSKPRRYSHEVSIINWLEMKRAWLVQNWFLEKLLSKPRTAQQQNDSPNHDIHRIRAHLALESCRSGSVRKIANLHRPALHHSLDQ
jgi:hypothetical protein